MAARRLLIVMLVLLGISTLAAALVPQSTLNDDSTSTRSTTTHAQTATAPEPAAGRSLTAQITVGPKKPAVVVAGPVCKKAKPRCEPIHVGDQLTLLVYSKPGAPLEFKEFGQFQFAAPNAAARFELLPMTPGRFGISFAATDRVAASVQILSAKKARKEVRTRGKDSKRRARGGSGQP
jgi:hypothetical protein